MKVELVTYTPDADLLVVNAARCSFGKEKEVFDEKDAKLINFLAREKHLLPFRHPHITLRCKAPMFVARQLGKHQTGMSWSEESRRYIDSPPEFFWPDAWRARADNVKQGSSSEVIEEFVLDDVTPEYEAAYGKVPPTKTQRLAESVAEYAVMQYDRMLKGGVAPELARMILPQNTMITWVWTGSLLAWVHMIKERSHPTAQKETRDFAAMVKSIMEDIAPASMAALMEDAG